MKKLAAKLMATVLMLAVAACLTVTVSYAWLTISQSPAVNGIQVTVGGGRTILLAPDLTETLEDGSVVHYPGAFQDKLVFSQYDGYDYLEDVAGLLPVSTADGLHWLLPDYYTAADQAVLDGYAFAGQMKPIQEFEMDDSLANANLTQDAILNAKGSYVYLDFWIVSPGSEYKLRVSTGEEEGGSFLIGLPYPTGDRSTLSGYTLTPAGENAAASARVGFLVNQDVARDDAMLAYQRSAGFSSQYSHLLGVYQQDGQNIPDAAYRFTIYEPNGTSHPESRSAEDGSYVVTSPLKWEYGTVEEADISPILTVQKANTWKMTEDGSDYLLEPILQTALAGKRVLSPRAAFSMFYLGEHLQGQVAPYVNSGGFISSTANLYAYADAGRSVPADTVEALESAGATEDVYITQLERNTPQRIRMFIWLEGQDGDCASDTSFSGIALGIELAGSN